MAGQYPEMDLPAGTTIVGVVPTFVNLRAGGQKQAFDIQCNNGQQYRTFSSPAAAQAQAAVGNPNVTIRISINGQYQNFEGVYPAGTAAPIQGAQVPQAGSAVAAWAAPPAQQFTPAPGFVDANKVEMRRVGGVQIASALLGPLVGSGFYLGENNTLEIDRLVSDLVALAGHSARYTVFGPQGENTPEQPQEAAPAAPGLPPGVTAEQVAAWAAAQGGDVQVGAPTAEPAAAGGGESY